MNPSPYLKIRGLSIQLEDFNLMNLDLDVQKGEYFVLVGPTGAGKTVLLESIAGLKSPESGTIHLAGKHLSSTSPETRKVGFVYQDYALFPHLNVEQNIAFGLKNSRQAGRSAEFGSGQKPGLPRSISTLLKGKSLKKHQIHNRVRELSTLFKINDLLDRKPDSLSGGEKQRVALARALITDPGILLLDEPLGSLDPETRETIQTELRRIQQHLGITTLHITHNFEVAVALADRIGVIIGGKLLQTGTGREVFRQPINEEVARFVGVRNIFRGQHIVEEDGCGYLKLDGIEFASISKLEGSVRASIRPEDILLSKQSLQSSARNNFPGIITQISERGPFNYVTVQLATRKNSKELDLVVMITQNSAAEFALELGQEVQIAFKASALHIF